MPRWWRCAPRGRGIGDDRARRLRPVGDARALRDVRRRDRPGPDRAGSISARADPKGGAVLHGPRLFAQPTCHHAPEVYPGIGEGEAGGAAAGLLSRRGAELDVIVAARRSCAVVKQREARQYAASPPLAPFPWIDVIIILRWSILNGLFAMSELAIVSSRRPRLKAMARAGGAARRPRSTLAADPGKFLSTVQIGITLIAHPRRRLFGRERSAGRSRERLALLGLPHETAADARLRAGHHPHHLCLAGDRRAGAQADRAALARADRGRRWPCRCCGSRGRRRRSSGCSTGRAACSSACCGCSRETRGPCHRRGAPPGRRRGADSRRARGERAGDHLGRGPPRRPADPRGDDAAHRGRLDRRRRAMPRRSAQR